MHSSTHIGKIVRQHADAVENGKVTNRKRKSKNSGLSALKTVTKHRAFVALVTVWAGLLLALMIAVLPDQAIARASSLSGIYLPLLVTRLILSVGMGLGGALLGFIVASALSNRAQVIERDGIHVSTFKSRDVDPINPTIDLGSESFDAPLNAEQNAETEEPAEFMELDEAQAVDEAEACKPKLGELAQRGYDIEAPEEMENSGSGDKGERGEKSDWAFTRKHFKDALIESFEGATCEASSGTEKSLKTEVAEPQSGFGSLTPELVTPRGEKPRSLDLSEFGEFPGRNAVWVEEQSTSVSEVPVERAAQQNHHAQTPQNALEKLRQTAPEDLSLVEMVERFAAALHDHQKQERKRYAESHVARENALAEALKALSLFTEAGFDSPRPAQFSESQLGQTEDELRAALERLQEMRGAA